MELTVENARKILEKYLGKNNKKLEHCYRVADVSKILANIWEVPEDDAIIVALLHDIGKSLNKKQTISLCMKNQVTVYDFELWETATALHGKVSEMLFRDEFERKEPERFDAIAHAIAYHVAGGEDKMSTLDKIIYIADNIEPAKNKELLAKVQSGEITDMNSCIRLIIQDKKDRAQAKKRSYNPMMDLTLENIEESDEISK